LVGLSAKHFACAFRQSTGVPPHRWLVERGIDRARELLTAGGVGLAEVALACGFAGQSRFTATFRKMVGLTPGHFQKQMQE
jgi:AraC family transcriptional regulator